jgi:hypothetical protein
MLKQKDHKFKAPVWATELRPCLKKNQNQNKTKKPKYHYYHHHHHQKSQDKQKLSNISQGCTHLKSLLRLKD